MLIITKDSIVYLEGVAR